MTPIEAAVKRAHERGYEGYSGEGCIIMPFDADDARAIIRAFLEAAAEDAGSRVALQSAFYNNHSDTIAASKAAILALKEAVG